MGYTKLKIIIKEVAGNEYKILIIQKKEQTFIYYNPLNQSLRIPHDDHLAQFLKERKLQLRKIFRNKKNESFYQGFKLRFVLKDIDYPSNIHFQEDKIAISNSDKDDSFKWCDKGKEGICQIFTDASYHESLKKGAYSILIKYPDSTVKIHKTTSKQRGNNLIELEAIIKGLKLTKNYKEIRFTTDSRYAIKGITEWVKIWRLNNWMTVSGERVKNRKHWKKLKKLITGKHVEFKWVKSHYNNSENNLCDFIAKKNCMNQFKFLQQFNINIVDVLCILRGELFSRIML